MCLIGQLETKKKTKTREEIIGEQNDFFRKCPLNMGENVGKYLITSGVSGNGEGFAIAALNAVQKFDDFTNENDPFGHHDFGSVEVEGEKVFWKIDLYDENYEYGSEDPTNPKKTRRVLTIMLPQEY